MNLLKNRQTLQEKGNVLFLVLIAVILFAALGYAATQTLRTGTADPQKESQNVRGIEVIQYATFVAESVMRMKFRGLADSQLCFDSPLWGNNDYDYGACDDEMNHVFSTVPDSGGVIWMKAAKGANLGESWYFTGHSCVPGIGPHQGDDCNSDGTSTSEELMMFLPNISKALCLEINQQLDIQNPNGNPPQASGNIWPAGMPVFTGSYADGGKVDSVGSGDASILRGREFGCVEGNGTPPAGTYVYFHTLLKR